MSEQFPALVKGAFHFTETINNTWPGKFRFGLNASCRWNVGKRRVEICPKIRKMRREVKIWCQRRTCVYRITNGTRIATMPVKTTTRIKRLYLAL
jgi:hypothetical protein